MEQTFIKTKDPKTAEVLMKHFRLLTSSDDEYVFINAPTDTFDFAEIDKSTYIETNTLKF